MSYFWGEVGMDKDLARHKEAKEDLERRLKDAKDERFAKAYTNFLHLLQDSKAELADKIGRKT